MSDDCYCYEGDEVTCKFCEEKCKSIPEIITLSVMGNFKKVKSLVEKEGVDVNTTDSSGVTPLSVAAFYGHEDLIEFLLSKGANPFAKCDTGRTPIHESLVRQNFGKSDRVFINYFAHFVKESGDVEMFVPREHEEVPSFTLLTLACGSRLGKMSPDTVEFLIKQGANVNIVLENGETPLLIASKENVHFHDHSRKMRTISLLIHAGAKVDAVDIFGRNALHYAVTFSPGEEFVRILCKAGVDANARDKHGETPLHRATKFCHHEEAKALIDFGGANVNVFQNEGYSPLHLAFKFKCYPYVARYETVLILLESNCTIDTLNAVLKDGVTTAYSLAKKVDYRIANFLRDAGANVSLPEEQNKEDEPYSEEYCENFEDCD